MQKIQALKRNCTPEQDAVRRNSTKRRGSKQSGISEFIMEIHLSRRRTASRLVIDVSQD
jgi:hypothetical protein